MTHLIDCRTHWGDMASIDDLHRAGTMEFWKRAAETRDWGHFRQDTVLSEKTHLIQKPGWEVGGQVLLHDRPPCTCALNQFLYRCTQCTQHRWVWSGQKFVKKHWQPKPNEGWLLDSTRLWEVYQLLCDRRTRRELYFPNLQVQKRKGALYHKSQKPRQRVSNADRKVFSNLESFCKSGKFLQQAHYWLKNFRIFWKMSIVQILYKIST